MTAERLSSRWTGAYRLAIPVLWLGFGALGLLALRAGGPEAWLLPVGLVWLAVSVLLAWLAFALCNVYLEGESLVVAGRRETLRIPFRDLERVSGTSLLDPELVWIRLRRPSSLGSRITFIPKGRGFRPFSKHPVVARLNELIGRHQAPGLPPPLETAGERGGGAGRAVAVAVVVLVAVGALIVAGIQSLARSANPYGAALEVARSHPLLVAELGEPIEAAWPEQTRIRVDGERAEAQFEIPVAGPRNRARLFVRASWQDGEWSFSRLDAALPNGLALDLLASGEAPPEPPGELL